MRPRPHRAQPPIRLTFRVIDHRRKLSKPRRPKAKFKNDDADAEDDPGSPAVHGAGTITRGVVRRDHRRRARRDLVVGAVAVSGTVICHDALAGCARDVGAVWSCAKSHHLQPNCMRFGAARRTRRAAPGSGEWSPSRGTGSTRPRDCTSRSQVPAHGESGSLAHFTSNPHACALFHPMGGFHPAVSARTHPNAKNNSGGGGERKSPWPS